MFKIHKTIYVETKTVSVPANNYWLKPGTSPENTNFDNVEQIPQFHGGDEAMYKYISHHIRYPNIAIENDVEGAVNVEFFVEEDGRITQVKAVDPSPSSGKSNIVATYNRQVRSEISSTDTEKGIRALQEYSEELIRGMPPFEPGQKQGMPVRAKVTLPITYQIN